MEKHSSFNPYSHRESQEPTADIPRMPKSYQCCWDYCLNRIAYADNPLCKDHLVASWRLIESREPKRFIDRLRSETVDELKALQAKWAREDTAARASAKERQSGPGHIYYIRVGDLIKIGFTTRLEQRLLQYPPNAELLADHPGTRATEQDMHGRFEQYRSRGREWFTAGVKLMEHISQVRVQFPRNEEIQQMRNAHDRKTLIKAETMATRL